MLPKKYRLSSKDFVSIKKEGRRVFGPLFGLLIKEEEEETENEPKFGFIVSKKVDKKAVIRNKIKRRLDQALLFYLPRIKPNAKAVFLAKKTLVDASFSEIQKEIERMLKRARLLSC